MSAQRKEYFSPPSPKVVRKLESIKRISRNKIDISQASEQKSVRSNRSQSQQNIKIVIETNIPQDC